MGEGKGITLRKDDSCNSTVAIYLRTPTRRLCVGIGPTLRKDDRCDSTLAIYLRTPTRRLLRMSEVKRKP